MAWECKVQWHGSAPSDLLFGSGLNALGKPLGFGIAMKTKLPLTTVVPWYREQTPMQPCKKMEN